LAWNCHVESWLVLKNEIAPNYAMRLKVADVIAGWIVWSTNSCAIVIDMV